MIDDVEAITRRLRWGSCLKAVFVKDREIHMLGFHTAQRREWERKSDWSLAGVFRFNADIEDVLDAVEFVRQEQRDLRRAMRNFDVRA